MIHDWLLSGEWTDPYGFAQKSYVQYPSFSIPFHPPAFPAMLGLVFTLTGVSYTAGRVFLAACAALGAGCVFRISRGFGAGPWAALFGGLLFLTTPEIARWSRDTMSDVPSIAMALAATGLYLRWLRTGAALWCWAAFAVAAIAFLCRVTSAGVLPSWFLFTLLSGQARRFRCWSLPLASVFYLAVGVAWVVFASRFSHYEMAADGRAQIFSWQNLAYFPACLPALAICGTLLPAAAGAVSSLVFAPVSAGLFWLSWLLSYALFKLAMPTTFETRHFLTALPCLAGFAVCMFDAPGPAWLRRVAAPALVVVGLGLNVMQLGQLPCGLVGYDGLGERMAALDKPGNVLLACWDDQELIFRYRAADPHSRRRMIRGDRTLAVRLADYAGVAPVVQARTDADVLEVVRRGRIRYLVTCKPADGYADRRAGEMVLAHGAAVANAGLFRLVAEQPIIHQYEGVGWKGSLLLWEYTGELPEGPSDLPVVVPTASMEILPGS